MGLEYLWNPLFLGGTNVSPSGPSGDVSVVLHILDIEKALKI